MSDAVRANPLVVAAFRFCVWDGTLYGDMRPTQTPTSDEGSRQGLQITADRRGWLGLTGLPVMGADPGYLCAAKDVAAQLITAWFCMMCG